jgi:type IV secretory pathway VirB2 component (pilin)
MQKTMNGRLSSARIAKTLCMAAVLAFANDAMAGPSIGSGGGTAYTKLTAWLQNFVDFMSGPFGIAVVVVSIILAFSVWAFAPKEGIAGPVMRIVVAAVVIVNVGTWLATFYRNVFVTGGSLLAR